MVPKQCPLLRPTFWYLICCSTSLGSRDNSKYHTYIPTHPPTHMTQVGFSSIVWLRLRTFGAQPPSEQRSLQKLEDKRNFFLRRWTSYGKPFEWFEIEIRGIGCLRKVRRISNLYISGSIGIERRIGYHVKASSKIFCLRENPSLGVTVLGSIVKGIFVMSSFTGTRENQYSDEAHFHLDCKVNSQNFRLWSHGK